MVHARVSCRFLLQTSCGTRGCHQWRVPWRHFGCRLKNTLISTASCLISVSSIQICRQEAHKLSAATARICLASRYSFPDQQARSDVQQLVKSYLEYDYPATKLQQLATKFFQQGLRNKLLLPFLLQVLSSMLNLSFFADVPGSLTMLYPSADLSRSSLQSKVSA